MFVHRARGLLVGNRPKFFTRQLSIKATYSGSFPTTLHHYRPTPTILYDRAEQGRRPHDLFEDSVVVNQDGLVYPSPSKTTDFGCNGAVIYPNTFNFQEMVRQYYDEMLDREDEGVKVDIPYIFTIPKGTPIPSSLILSLISVPHFSLQPSFGMPLQDLNDRLRDFFAQHSIKEKTDCWLDEHPYSEAFPDTEADRWMRE